MANVVENLGKLERRVTISLPKEVVQKEIDARIQKLAKNVRMPGFRPGKVPLKMVAQQYAGQVEAEVLSDKIGQEFFEVSRTENLRVAGQPSFAPKAEAAADAYAFDATFEVYPEVKIGDLATAEVERATTSIGDAEIDRTLDILRKQRVHFHARGEGGEHGDGGAETAAQNGDRVTVDFVGKIDDVAFPGGTAEDFPFVLGEGRMLPEFETAALGLKVGEAREFDLTFPEDYHGKDVAGKTAKFTVTMKKVEWPHLPEIDGEFAKTLGIEDGDTAKMRNEIKENLEREAKRRTQSLVKNQVMDAVLKISELDVPNALVEQDQQRLVEMARQDLAQRGVPNAANAPIPVEMFKEQAERRVKLGLVIAELVKANGLEAKPEQIRAEVDEFAKSYEDPKEVVRWYYSNQQRLAEMEAFVVESNVVDFVLGKAKVTDKEVSFEALASASAQA
ncbi:trigger factor [Burkholderia gladioli]|uniref:trigger factor n=1 Tax=Burkholderia gladioli TaxID=28095 RepID=UPI000BBD0484|nr:trigger factor [Burkholderia gladioli]ATF83937.1 trigger factor [Burkholderia gladioli pv. gladioli]MBJ9709905.1 trigger factor [Burkholderia gladioli]MBU9153841.1 trigger factor [Burkholderia gladioli]MBU9194956.1 trigger factor [Burkholderia gladioli]MBU9212795.1 trigger factor [Burkholderia gladioli]